MRKLFTIIITALIGWAAIIAVFALVNLLVTFIMSSPFMWIPMVTLAFIAILWVFNEFIKAMWS